MGYGQTDVYFLTYALSDNVVMSNDVGASNDVQTWLKKKEMTIGSTIGSSSVFRYFFHLSSSAVGTPVKARIYINGVAEGTEQTINTVVGADFTEDIAHTSWKIGDTVELWLYGGIAACIATATNFRIKGVGSEWIKTL